MVSDSGVRHSFTFVGGGEMSTIGGIVRTITEIANHLAQQGHKVRYLAKLSQNSVPFYELHENVILEPISYPYSSSQIKSFAKRLKRLETDVLIVALSGKLALNVMKATEDLPFSIVRSEHGNPAQLLKSIWKGDKLARACTFQLADYTHLLFPEFAKNPDLGKAIHDTMCSIPSPIELNVPKASPSKPTTSGKMKIVSAGRIEKFEKNSNILLTSFLKLAEEFPDWECHFLGEGSQKEELQQISRKHVNGAQVFFHGSVKKDILSKHFTSSHLFVIPSDTEGCPMALGEALAHGLPAIGFADCTGVNKMIIHEKNGLLAGNKISKNGFSEVNYQSTLLSDNEPQPALFGNDLDNNMDDQIRSNQLAAAMRMLMMSSELREKYAANAPNSVLNYERSSVLERWSDFLVGIALRTPDITSIRNTRYETYPELHNASQTANEAIKRFMLSKKTKSFRDILPFAMLYGNK